MTGAGARSFSPQHATAQRQVKSPYWAANKLNGTFSQCSTTLKKLFCAYCVPVIYGASHRCIAAGKYLGVRRIFARRRISPSLPEKLLGSPTNFLSRILTKNMKAFFGEKVKFRRFQSVNLIDNTNKTRVSKHLCPNFSGILPRFSTNRNFFRRPLTP